VIAPPAGPRITGAGVHLQRRAGAHQVTVAVRVVDAAHRRPVLRRRPLTQGRPPPRAGTGASTRRPRCLGRVRRVAQRVVVDRPLARPTLRSPRGSRSSRRRTGRVRAATPTRWLHQQRARHRERHGGCVEAVVHHRLATSSTVTPDASRMGRKSRLHSCATVRAPRCRAPGNGAPAARPRSSRRGSDLGARRSPSGPSSRCTPTGSPVSRRPPRAARSAHAARRTGGRLERVVGQYGANAAHRHRPTPGPPPPCGMQKSCAVQCETSAPNSPGFASPTRRSGSRVHDTWPPCACTTSQISRISSSNTPCVDGRSP